MTNRADPRRRALCWLLVLVLPALVVLRAEQKAPETNDSTPHPEARVLRTPDGRPDLQGVWNFSSLTPLERPSAFAGKEVVYGDEATALQRLRQQHPEGSHYDRDVFYEDAAHGENRNQKVSQLRTSLIVDPPDGRRPATPEGRKRIAETSAAYARMPVDGPEEKTLADRCLVGFNAGPPMTPAPYNNNVQIYQTRDHLVVLNEMVHNARVIPLDGRPHLPSVIRLWSGDSRGRWEGDTLVVETTNFKDQPLRSPGFSSTAQFRLVERFSRLNTDTLRYEFTVTDPEIYSAPWTARFDMQRGKEVHDYSCHEGNYALRNLLSQSRAVERNGEQPQK